MRFLTPEPHRREILRFAETQRSPEVAGPFLPLEPEGYREAKKRIMFIGKATAGEFGNDRPVSADTVQDLVSRVLEDDAARPASPFWNFIARVTSGVLGIDQLSVKEALRSVIWNNLIKVGRARGNPTGELLKAQRNLAIGCLESEVERADPQIVVLMTNNYEICVWANALSLKWNDSASWAAAGVRGDRGAIWLARQRNRMTFWCRHPQGKSRAWLEHVVKFIVTEATSKPTSAT